LGRDAIGRRSPTPHALCWLAGDDEPLVKNQSVNLRYETGQLVDCWHK
jgi:hypothetical protein